MLRNILVTDNLNLVTESLYLFVLVQTLSFSLSHPFLWYLFLESKHILSQASLYQTDYAHWVSFYKLKFPSFCSS